MTTPSTAPFHIDVRADGDNVTVHIAGELDAAATPCLRTYVDGVIATTTTGEVVVDLTDVSFIDSSGISALLDARQRLTGERRRMRVANTSLPVARIFEMTGLRDVFDCATG